MRAVDIILRKRDGAKLSPEEISFFIRHYLQGSIADYQVSALLMAIYFQGMDAKETAALTEALVNSGETLDFSGFLRPVGDKHSTGGVGDKTTLVLLPLVAAKGMTMAKMSGRGLGHTGGTIDKLACIPGFRTDLSRREFMAQVKELGVAVMGQSPEMTPADGQLYALRDVTATVDSIPLIASSVMSKKIAAGAGTIVLDVKAGSGAFMQDAEEARQLAEAMVDIGSVLGRKTVALITDMDQPLGHAVGNHLEVAEAIETLQGHGPADLRELSLELGAELLAGSGIMEDRHQAKKSLQESLSDGSALEMFRRFVTAQGGDAGVADDLSLLGSSPHRLTLTAPQNGYIGRLDARTVGNAAVLSGAGREKKGDDIDLLAGIRLYKKRGEKVQAGEVLAEVSGSHRDKLQAALEKLSDAYSFSEKPPAPQSLIIERVAK
ncbi:thymidine phosphorylase [Dethiobacter alkaliphilus]|uniref:Pyrimidine-nucleoside phosphorylase n=1 Tax=Dethiobacter alkaliphilus AHT 1 TaxID=555088 RepID=C0GE01_DETAL|nr:thymidine phosphorylase [Dethiobacter alkaliphilus]EEG78295.1 pyrimidine-nucleoside phosphorylase [Dethiobacter alkaliphilus AHT 1]